LTDFQTIVKYLIKSVQWESSCFTRMDRHDGANSLCFAMPWTSLKDCHNMHVTIFGEWLGVEEWQKSCRPSWSCTHQCHWRL